MIDQSILFNFAYSSGGSLVDKIRVAITFPTAIVVLLACVIAWAITLRTTKVNSEGKIIYSIAMICSIVSVMISGKAIGHYYEYLIPLLFPMMIVVCEKIPFVYKLIQTKQKLTGILLFVGTICVNLMTPVCFVLYRNGTNAMQAIDAVATKMEGIVKKDDKVIINNNNALFYLETDYTPHLKHFYIPLIEYKDYPDAIDEQAQSILSGENKVVVIHYFNYDKKQIFRTNKYDTEILEYLKKNYRLELEKNGFEMWVAN